MSIGYIWGIVGDENVPMQVDVEDVNQNPHLIYDMAQFEDDMNQSTSASASDDKPF